jgi:hypothetical protein
MKHVFVPIAILCIISSANAQAPEDVLRYSWFGQNGTARNQAVGGAMGSLGGDITATFVNPAGLGLYKTNEFVLSPGFQFLRNKTNFRETEARDKKNAFNLGTSGLVFGSGGDQGSNWKSKAVSIAVTRTANFSNKIFYTGENNASSYSEQFATEVANSGVDIGDVTNAGQLSLGSRMAAYTYLIDTATLNGVTQVIGLPELVGNRLQQNSIDTRGGITDVALGLAGNMNEKFYLGGSISLSVVNYERDQTYEERDLSGNTNNNFGYSRFEELYTTKGAGVNAKLGIMFKPVDNIRFGLALHSPTIYNLKDTYQSTMSTETENYVPGLVTVKSDVFTGDPYSIYKYNHTTPWKFLASGSYVFKEIEDVTRQKGFISADIEYINYKASAYQVSEEGGSSDESYYTSINNTIDDIYKGNFNLRLGGELKFNTIMARAGFAHYGSPYVDKELKANRSFISGGLGYRDKGIFIDLTYVYATNKDVSFPYRLSDKANTFANIKGRGDNAILTFGFKF